MKHQAIVGNIGHFDNEIDMADYRAWSGPEQCKPQTSGSLLTGTRSSCSARPVTEPGNATGHRLS